MSYTCMHTVVIPSKAMRDLVTQTLIKHVELRNCVFHIDLYSHSRSADQHACLAFCSIRNMGPSAVAMVIPYPLDLWTFDGLNLKLCWLEMQRWCSQFNDSHHCCSSNWCVTSCTHKLWGNCDCTGIDLKQYSDTVLSTAYWQYQCGAIHAVQRHQEGCWHGTWGGLICTQTLLWTLDSTLDSSDY